jgi:hypothetical protein
VKLAQAGTSSSEDTRNLFSTGCHVNFDINALFAVHFLPSIQRRLSNSNTRLFVPLHQTFQRVPFSLRTQIF